MLTRILVLLLLSLKLKCDALKGISTILGAALSSFFVIIYNYLRDS